MRALEFYGGSARAVVPDNLKSGVTVASWYEPELNPSYLEWARTYSRRDFARQTVSAKR